MHFEIALIDSVWGGAKFYIWWINLQNVHEHSHTHTPTHKAHIYAYKWLHGFYVPFLLLLDGTFQWKKGIVKMTREQKSIDYSMMSIDQRLLLPDLYLLGKRNSALKKFQQQQHQFDTTKHMCTIFCNCR